VRWVWGKGGQASNILDMKKAPAKKEGDTFYGFEEKKVSRQGFVLWERGGRVSGLGGVS